MERTELLFINALSGNAERAHYDSTGAQQLIAPRFGLPLAAVQRAWAEIDMTGVLEISAGAGHAQGLPPWAEVLPALIADAAALLRLQVSQLHCVIVVPAIGHVSALSRLANEAARLTGQLLTPVIVLWRDESGELQLFHVIPEPEGDDEFAAALAATREQRA